MKKINFKIILLGCLFFIGCSKAVYIDTSTIRVSEEGGTKLTMFSKNEDNIVSPYIEKESNKIISWFSTPLLSLSTDGSRLAYLSKSNGFDNIFIKDLVQGQLTVQRTFDRYVNGLNFSHDGKQLAFSQRNNDVFDIFEIDANAGVALRQIANTNSTEIGPVYSKHDNEIYYAKSDGKNFYLWGLNLVNNLHTQYSEGYSPCLGLNENEIFVSRNNKSTNYGEIWKIDIKNGIETLILGNSKTSFSTPQISPDGKKIICVGLTQESSNRLDNLDLYLVNIDGTALSQITFHEGNDVSPIWSPDGNSIFFISQRGNKDGVFNIWKMGLNFK